MGAVGGSHAIICDANNPAESPHRQQLEKQTKDLFLTFHCFCTRKDVCLDDFACYMFVLKKNLLNK